MPQFSLMLHLYGRFALLSFITFYLVILAGGIVRMTGSGMGCPDWPKCFGQIIPPTSANQIPENYKDIYAQMRKDKNAKLATLLSKIGLENLGTKIINDESIYVEQDFNVAKTYTEYINRLIGAISGIFVLLSFIFALFLLKMPVYFIWAGLLVILTGFQAWLGSIVVSTNLLPGMISIHMLLAFVLIAIAMHMFKIASHNSISFKISKEIQLVLWACILATLLQVIIGTQVRQEIDVLKNYQLLNRSHWLNELGSTYSIHKIFSAFVVGLNLFLFYLLFQLKIKKWWINLIPAAVLIALFSGLIMNFFEVPALMQPIHLFIAAVIFGAQFFIFLSTSSGKRVK